MESLVKEKAKYQVEKSLYETGHTFMQFTPVGRALFLIFLLGSIPAYYGSKYASIKYFDLVYSKSHISAKPSTVLASPLVNSAVSIYPTSERSYSALATITNPNLDISVGTTNYSVRFFDSSGKELYKYSDSFFLSPNEQKYLVVPRIDTDFAPASAKLEFTDPHFVKRFTIPKISFQSPTPQVYSQSTPQAFVVEGGVYNDSPYFLKIVRVKVLLYDSGGKVVGATSTELGSVKPFERRSYKLLWPGQPYFAVARAQAFPETNVLDPENLRLQADAVPQTGGGR